MNTQDAQPQDAQPQDAQPQDAQPQDAQPQDAQPTLKGTHIIPRTNLYQVDKGWMLIAELPKAAQDQISLQTHGQVLELVAPRTDHGFYKRSIRFPHHTEWGEINAEWRGGLLQVNLKTRDVLTREIPVMSI